MANRSAIPSRFSGSRPAGAALILFCVASAPILAEADTAFFVRGEYRLARGDEGFRLVAADGTESPVPGEWLEPPEALAADEHAYVTSLAWELEITSFPVGGGLVGLHLSSYAIQSEGSAGAAAGRDLFLALDPDSGRLRRGLDLGESKGRVRLGGCVAAWFRRVRVGDVDCDRRLDLAVTDERISCEVPADGSGLARAILSLGPLRWHRWDGEAWTATPELDGALPCAGLRPLPLLGIVRSPIDMVLDHAEGRPPLLPEPTP